MVIILMGVAGAGKTTVGKLLAEELGWPFYEGDEYHPHSNVAKMGRGIPLSDEDRWPWLDTIHDLIEWLSAQGQDAVLACSALKQSYRDRLDQNTAQIRFVYLKGDRETVRERLSTRTAHFMGAGMLVSQFATLEEPEDALTVDISQKPCFTVGEIRTALNL